MRIARGKACEQADIGQLRPPRHLSTAIRPWWQRRACGTGSARRRLRRCHAQVECRIGVLEGDLQFAAVMRRMRFSSSETIFLALEMTLPDVAFCRLSKVKPVVDLPQPDSPTRKAFRRRMSRLTSSTACTVAPRSPSFQADDEMLDGLEALIQQFSSHHAASSGAGLQSRRRGGRWCLTTDSSTGTLS